MSRDPNRIPIVIEALRLAWTMNPDLRLGQLIWSAARDKDPFCVEDYTLVRALREMVYGLGADVGDDVDYSDTNATE